MATATPRERGRPRGGEGLNRPSRPKGRRSPRGKAAWVAARRVAPAKARGDRGGSCPTGVHRPVLKHGPRSLTGVRVLGPSPDGAMKVRKRCEGSAGSTGLPRASARGERRSTPARTRKMVNYA